MSNDKEDYYTRIEDLEEELPDRVLKDLNQINQQEDDDVSVFSFDEILPKKEESNTGNTISYVSLLGDTLVLFLIVTFVLNKRFIKYIGEFNISLPKNIIMASISALSFLIYKFLLMMY